MGEVAVWKEAGVPAVEGGLGGGGGGPDAGSGAAKGECRAAAAPKKELAEKTIGKHGCGSGAVFGARVCGGGR